MTWHTMNIGPNGVKLWLPWEELEDGAKQQVVDVALHPELHGHVAIMPDSHVGYGVPIGCIFSTEGSIIPNAVGVDQGCGMQTIRTGVKLDPELHDRAFWDLWAHHVERQIPTGFRTHTQAIDSQRITHHQLRAKPIQEIMDAKVGVQLGTLGGGNHFLEAQVDAEGYIWFMVHSGSRGTGNKLAAYYHELAIAETRHRGLKVGADLASLSWEDKIAHDYYADLQWSMAFAEMSRTLMIAGMLEAFDDAGGEMVSAEYDHNFDCMHNYAVFDRQTTLHRKGATAVEHGEWAIIPGSMGTKSYIVSGQISPDNMESYGSCSHGAGRVMGRNAAKRALDLEDVNANLARTTFSTVTKNTLDEAPEAYKDIETVIDRQRDIINIEFELTPVRTVKGDTRARDD